MGDDCNAPNDELIPVGENERLSDIFHKIAAYLPQMYDVIWAVDSGRKVIGYIVVDKNGQAQYELCMEDRVFGDLELEALHCSYFHQRSFVYRNEKENKIIEKYPQCYTLLEKVTCCMKERFLYELEIKGGSLCFWGEWFGRPCDNFHVIKSVQWEQNEVVLHFKGEELLYIRNPVGIINEKECLIIQEAAQILWAWYPDDKEHTYKHLYIRQYTKNADGEIGLHSKIEMEQ